MKGKFLFIFFTFLCLVLIPGQSLARDEVKDSGRLELLRNATGRDSSRSSYQARVDAMLNPSTDPGKSVLARREERQANVLAEATPDSLLFLGVSASPKSEQEQEAEEGEEPDDFENLISSRTDARELSYQESLQRMGRKLIREDKKRRAAAIALKEATEEPTEKESSLRPSLAYNPFYFEQTGEKTFEEQKPVIASRLMQQGYDTDRIQEILSEGSTPEDIILILMHEENYTYGEALEIVPATE